MKLFIFLLLIASGASASLSQSLSLTVNTSVAIITSAVEKLVVDILGETRSASDNIIGPLSCVANSTTKFSNSAKRIQDSLSKIDTAFKGIGKSSTALAILKSIVSLIGIVATESVALLTSIRTSGGDDLKQLNDECFDGQGIVYFLDNLGTFATNITLINRELIKEVLVGTTQIFTGIAGALRF